MGPVPDEAAAGAAPAPASPPTGLLPGFQPPTGAYAKSFPAFVHGSPASTLFYDQADLRRTAARREGAERGGGFARRDGLRSFDGGAGAQLLGIELDAKTWHIWGLGVQVSATDAACGSAAALTATAGDSV